MSVSLGTNPGSFQVQGGHEDGQIGGGKMGILMRKAQGCKFTGRAAAGGWMGGGGMERDDQKPFCTRIRGAGESEPTNNLVGGDLSGMAHGECLNCT